MAKYYINDAEGYLLRQGECPSTQIALQANSGETAVAGKPKHSSKPLPNSILKSIRIKAVTNKATKAIEIVYSPLKQRKLNSIATALHDKYLFNPPLTTEDEKLLQMTRDVNTWITAIRTAENIAIADGTLVEDFNP